MGREANSRPIFTSLASGDNAVLFESFNNFCRLEISRAESDHSRSESAFFWGINVYTLGFLKLFNDFGGDIPTPFFDLILTNFPEKLNLFPEGMKGRRITLA